jgi:3-deoxy-D-manno-octulosonic-acid transferase
MDRIEKKLLNSDYLDLIDLFTAQTRTVRNGILAAGASAEKVVVTGNIKFDALDQGVTLPQPQDSLGELLTAVSTSERLIITAGCVTNIAEQEYVLDAFKLVIEQVPDALLILAPRHPENIDRMLQLADLLADRNLSHVFRTQQQSYDMSGVSVLVLDTLGELVHMYGVAQVCFVGLNHNVLEPLSLGKPVVVTPGWEKSFPSYPVYIETKKSGLIYESDNREGLAKLFLDLLQHSKDGGFQATIMRRVQGLKGATQRNLELVNEVLFAYE